MKKKRDENYRKDQKNTIPASIKTAPKKTTLMETTRMEKV